LGLNVCYIGQLLYFVDRYFVLAVRRSSLHGHTSRYSGTRGADSDIVTPFAC